MNNEEVIAEMQKIHSAVNARYVGQRALIISDYNGQPYGSSRRSLRGTTVEIKHVFIDIDGMHFLTKEHSLCLGHDELAFYDAADADTERFGIKHAENVIDQQATELLKLKTKAAEVVAELRGLQGDAFEQAADIVADKLGVK